MKHFLLFSLLFTFYGYSIWAQNSLSTVGAGSRWVACGDIDVSGTNITVEAMFRRPAVSNMNLVSKHTDPSNVNYLLRPTNFQITTTNGFRAVISPIPIALNTWYHLAATYNGSSVKLYVNGCLVADSALTGTMIQNDLITAIGTQANNVNIEHFRGNIDEVRIWNVTRTQQEILNNMNNLPNPTTQTGLLAYYKFDNNYLNIQGNATFNGTPQGTPTYDTEATTILVPQINNVALTPASCFGYTDGALTISAVGNGITYTINGTNYFTDSTFSNLGAGSYTAQIKTTEGCLVSQVVQITEPPQVPTPDIVYPTPLCEGDILTLHVDSIPNGQTYWSGPNGFQLIGHDTTIQVATAANNSGTYSVYTLLDGCSSDTLQENIVVNPIYDLNVTATICSNESYTLGTQQLTQPGNYQLALQTVAGCDSIVNLTLFVNPAYSFVRDTTLCEGESFTYQGQTISTTGAFPFYLQTTLNCDSTIIYDVIVYPIPAAPILSSNSPLTCPGDTVFMNAAPVIGGTFNWNGPNGFSSTNQNVSFSAGIPAMGNYEATVTVNGCTSPPSTIPLDIINIYTFDDKDFPNVISPNGDNINEDLDLVNYFQTCQKFEIDIVDRWGIPIYFFTNDDTPFAGIDKRGKEVADGVYFYRLKYEEGTKSGFIQVVR